MAEEKSYHPNPEDNDLYDVGRTLRDIRPAHYTLKVDSLSFLVQVLEATGEKRYESQVFEASGYKWKLCLYPNGDQERDGKGHVSLYLAIANTDDLPLGWEVNVSFKLFVFDQNRDKYLTIEDAKEKIRRYHAMKTEWGFSKLLPLSVFNDPTKGYLVGDKCVFGAEVFVIKYSGAGELLPQPKTLTEASYTWRISKFSDLTNTIPTTSFTLGDLKWIFKLHPKGYPIGEHNEVDLRFSFLDLDVTSDTGRVYANYAVIIKNQSDGIDIKATDNAWFRSGYCKRWKVGKRLGSVTDASNKGFLVNDTLVVKFEIKSLFVVERFA